MYVIAYVLSMENASIAPENRLHGDCDRLHPGSRIEHPHSPADQVHVQVEDDLPAAALDVDEQAVAVA